MKLIIVGVGKMGAQIASRLVRDGFEVVAIDADAQTLQGAVDFGAQAANDRIDAVNKFDGEKVVVWLMIPAKFVTSEVSEWIDVLPEGSLLIDGGNTNFRESIEHAQNARSKNMHFLDIGVSGGILGDTNGFSMMVGGDEVSYNYVKPVLDSLSKPRGGHEYFGESGSGHYVKMVHNAIEYGMMESLAEGYEMLKNGQYDELDLAKVSSIWQKASVIESTLNQLISEIMSSDSSLPNSDGYVARSGEADWAMDSAKEYGVEMPSIQASLDVRAASEQGIVSYKTKLLAELRNKFGGHKVNK